MAICKICGRPIIWVKTVGRKSMPCDPQLVHYWAKPKAAGKVVTPNGEVKSCEFAGREYTATGVGYVPHWATCKPRQTTKPAPEAEAEQIDMFGGMGK